MKSTLKLYIVNQGDSLESIAKKMNCNIDEIKQLNRLIKNKLITNQPLLVPFKELDETREMSNMLSNDEMLILLFQIKETFLTGLFCFDAYDLMYNKTLNYINKISDDTKRNLFLRKLLNFPAILIRKDEKQLINYEKDLKKLLEEIEDKENTQLNKTNLKYLSEQYQLYILKIGNKNYKEAENIFNNILNTINLF